MLGTPDPALSKALFESKHIELSGSLIHNGRAAGPRDSDWSELAALFPTTFQVEVCPPFVVIRLRDVPKRPWPFTIGGLPVFFTSKPWEEPYTRGVCGKGKKVLEELDLSRNANVDDEILHRAAHALTDAIGIILDIFWWSGCWSVTVPNHATISELPLTLAHCLVFYSHKKDQISPDPSALHGKKHSGVDYDDSLYGVGTSSLLRPGVMVSSTEWTKERPDGKQEDLCHSTTSGVLVTDVHGNKFITVAAHEFGSDGLVWHPKQNSGHVIGRIVEKLSGTDIAIVEISPRFSYVNTTFGTQDDPKGIEFEKISSSSSPAMEILEPIFMDNPFSGRCEGRVLSTGLVLEGDVAEGRFLRHMWMVMENGDAPIDGSCGCPIWDKDENLAGFFRYQSVDKATMCLGVMAKELEVHGYSLYQGMHTSTE